MHKPTVIDRRYRRHVSADGPRFLSAAVGASFLGLAEIGHRMAEIGQDIHCGKFASLKRTPFLKHLCSSS